MGVGDLRLTLAGKLKLWGADKSGVADLSSYRQEIISYYGHTWDNYDRAISVAVYFPRQIVNSLMDGPNRAYLTYYDALNTRLNDIAFRCANFLESYGFPSFPIPASQREGESKLSAIFSHRLAARCAGIGWVGRNCSIVTPEAGPRVRLVTILTTAPLAVDKPLDRTCPPGCSRCLEACPPGALGGVDFYPGQPLAERADMTLCDSHLAAMRISYGKRLCGRCLAACPIGHNTPNLKKLE